MEQYTLFMSKHNNVLKQEAPRNFKSHVLSLLVYTSNIPQTLIKKINIIETETSLDKINLSLYHMISSKFSLFTKMSLISEMFGDEAVDPFLSLIDKCPVLSIPTDWKETPGVHVFTYDLPGLKKEEAKVEVNQGRVLQINGERKVENDGDHKNDKWHRVERCAAKFLRRFKLPENAKTDEVKASMENVALMVVTPKQQVKRPEKKMIEIEEIKS